MRGLQTDCMANILGVDWGSKIIGLARGSQAAGLATPLPSQKNDARLKEALRAVIAQEKIEKIIVGLPLGLEGKATMQTKTIRQATNRLAKQLGVPVEYQAEDLTSQVVAHQARTTKFDIHSLAACMILQDYLNENRAKTQ